MRGILAATLLALMARAESVEECTHAVELMFVQGASFYFEPVIEAMQAEVRAIMENFTATYEEFKMGIAGFVDKPIPTLGIGGFGNKQWVVEDYCYWRFASLSTDPTELEWSLDDLYWNMGSGGDTPEAPLDAMAYAVGDATAGWTSGTRSGWASTGEGRAADYRYLQPPARGRR